MFIVKITYKKPLIIVDKYLDEHRNFLEKGYQQNFFVASGPLNPRTGGIIISNLKDKKKLEAILAQDPFQLKDIADYEFIEFTPVKFHKNFASFVE